MTAIFRSLAWEFFARHGWMVATMIAVANALPLLILGSLSKMNVDLDAMELTILPMALIPYNVCVVALAMMAGQGSASRLYLKPISSFSLASVFFVSGCLLTALGVAASLSLWRFLFDIHWPVARPTMISAAMWAGLYPAFRISVKTPARIIEVIALVIFYWFWSIRFQPVPSGGDWYLHTIQPLDVLITVAFIILGYYLAVYRITADRSGRNVSFVSELFRRWAIRWDQRGNARTLSFESQTANPFRAFGWYEWTLRGRPLAFCVTVITVVIATVNTCIVLLGDRPAAAALTDIREGLAPVLLMHIGLAAVVGFFATLLDDQSIQQISGEDQIELNRRSTLGEFRSTLPMSDKQMAGAIQAAIIKTTLFSCLLMICVVTVVFGLSYLFESPRGGNELSFGGLFAVFAIVVLGSWAAMTNGTVFAYLLTGKRWLAWLIPAFMGLLFIGSTFPMIMTMLLTICCLMITFWSLWSSYRSNLITANIILASILFLATMAITGWMIANTPQKMNLAMWILILSSLTVLPISALPKVIAVSRHT